MAFERVWENISRSLSPKAKSTNFMPARTSKKVEILSQGKNFWGPSMLNSNRAVFEVKPLLNSFLLYHIDDDDDDDDISNNIINTSRLFLSTTRSMWYR